MQCAGGLTRKAEIQVARGSAASIGIQCKHVSAHWFLATLDNEFRNRSPFIELVEHRRIEHVRAGFDRVVDLV